MLFIRFKTLICVLFFLFFFIVISLKEFIVLDNFENNFLNVISKNETQCNQAKVDENEIIDLVYTWVNGSDLELRKLIYFYQQLNKTDQCDYVKTPFLIIIPEVIIGTINKLISNIPKSNKKKEWISIDYEIEKDVSSSAFYFEDPNKAQEYLINKPIELTNYKIHQLYFAKSSCNNREKDLKQIKLRNLIKFDNRKIDKDTKFKFIKDMKEVLRMKDVKYKFEIENYEIIALDSRFDINGIEALANLYSKHQIEFGEQTFIFKLITSDLKLHPNDDAFSENRFSDKDELKYSLRSVEKYANWVRNIYIVTNGQIPNWLNTSHPQIKMVNHKSIFTNQSDLPTFNSASIEFNLHRIKGLSKKFLYLNDDFLFGQPVYLEDFYSRSKGYQIRLGWSVPNCLPNCPTAWLSDGICDKSCNSSVCLYDGGDCLKSTKNDHESTSANNQECKAGCPLTWLADKNCDTKCNNLECGYDLGDCSNSVQDLKNAFEFANYADNQTMYRFDLTSNKKGIYLNMTNYFDELHINKELEDLKLNSNNKMYIKKLAFNQINKLIIILLERPDKLNKLFFNLSFKLNHQATDRINLVLEVNLIDTNSSPSNRKLMDFYADSLKYSNYIINKKYSIQIRKVPAHMPILLDQDILERMNIELYDEIQATSSHKFRNSNDLQFAFTYYYFLMSEEFHPTLERILSNFDRNLDQNLNRNEARTFYLTTTKNDYEEKDFELFWNESIDCSLNNGTKNKLPISVLINCNEFDFLNDESKIKKRNQFVTLKMNDVSFNQINNNIDQLRTNLDKVRKSPTQFICINDNFSYHDPEKSKLVYELLHDFYESILPLKSKFEIDDQTDLNLKIKTDQFKSSKIDNQNRTYLLVFILFCAFICLFVRLCYYKSKANFSTISIV